MARKNRSVSPVTAVQDSTVQAEESVAAFSTGSEAVADSGASAAVVVPEAAAVPVVRVTNISLEVAEYVPLATGMVRLGPKEFVDAPLTDVNDATRQVENAGRIVIQLL